MLTETEAGTAIAFTARERAERVPWPRDATPLADHDIAGESLVSLASPGTELQGYRAERLAPALSGYAAVFRVREIGAAVRGIAPGDRMFCCGPHRSWQRCRAADAVRLPDGLAPEQAVFCRLIGVSWSTLTTTRARPPDRVLITGLGPVGNLAAQLFAASGYEVTAVDPVPGRRALACTLGLHEVLPAVPASAAEDGGARLGIDCSGHEAAILDLCRVVGKGGEVVQVGVPWAKRTDASAHELLSLVFHRYLHLRSGWEWEVPTQAQEFRSGSIMANLAAAMRWLAAGRVRTDGLATLVSPDQSQRSWQALLAQTSPAPTVIFDWRDARPLIS